jgi:hypothetical protein
MDSERASEWGSEHVSKWGGEAQNGWCDFRWTHRSHIRQRKNFNKTAMERGHQRAINNPSAHGTRRECPWETFPGYLTTPLVTP